MSRLSHTAHTHATARGRRLAALIWGSFLVFVFVAGFASRVWLR
jgi:hypothetical protein